MLFNTLYLGVGKEERERDTDMRGQAEKERREEKEERNRKKEEGRRKGGKEGKVSQGP